MGGGTLPINAECPMAAEKALVMPVAVLEEEEGMGEEVEEEEEEERRADANAFVHAAQRHADGASRGVEVDVVHWGAA